MKTRDWFSRFRLFGNFLSYGRGFDFLKLVAKQAGRSMYKSQVCALSVMRRPHIGNALLSRKTPIHSVRLLAAGVLAAGMAQADVIVKGTVTVPPNNQDTNGNLNIGTGNGKNEGVLNILVNDLGVGEVTAGQANLGQGSADALGTVNVINPAAPNATPTATFTTSKANNGNIVVGSGGTGNLFVDNGLVQSATQTTIGDPNNGKGTGTITALRGARIVSQTNGITVFGTGTVNLDNSTLTAANTGD